jgi:very-short-patch-repair endonuclease
MSRVQALPIRRGQAMRRNPTAAEDHLWQALRAQRLGGWTWKRQVPFGPFILDFLCREARLVIELDGGYHDDDTQLDYDLRRTAYLRRQGLRVLRFANAEVLRDRESVCAAILRVCA